MQKFICDEFPILKKDSSCYPCMHECVCMYIYVGMCLAQAEFKSFLVTLTCNQVWATPRTFVTKCFITKASMSTGIDRALLQEESQNLHISHWYVTNLKMKWLNFSPSMPIFADLRYKRWHVYLKELTWGSDAILYVKVPGRLYSSPALLHCY